MYKQYHWLEEKKKQMKSKKKTPVIGNSVHAGVNRDFLYTGDGNFNDTAGYTSNGQAVHKGELMYKGPGNGQVIMDATSSRELMSNPVIGGQQRYASGFQTGGVVNSTEGDRIRSRGLRGIENIMQSGSVAGNMAGKAELEGLKGTQGVERQVLKQESAQRGLSDAASAGGLARQRAEHEGQIADVTGKVAIEGMQAKERAAGRLASEGMADKQFEEGKRQFDVGFGEGKRRFDVGFEEGKRQFDIGQEFRETTFGESVRQFNIGQEFKVETFEDAKEKDDRNFRERVRQFDVGTDQWTKTMAEAKRVNDRSFYENVRQFDAGNEQWWANFNEGIRVNERNFNENVRQFEVGSDQWMLSHTDNMNHKWAMYNEGIRQFDVNTAESKALREDRNKQWAAGHKLLREQTEEGTRRWNESHKLERERYTAGDEQWWASFTEQVTSRKITDAHREKLFAENIRQFDVGSEQWVEMHKLRKKEFQRGLDMDKHTVNVWKDNKNFRDQKYFDDRKDIDFKKEMERDVHEKNMEVIDLQIDATLSNAESKDYWDGSKRIFNYVSTHIDGYNKETGELTDDALNEMYEWAMKKYPGYGEKHGPLDEFKDENDPDYQNFKKWAISEWQAASDNRLINPYDKMLYTVRSSTELNDETKNVIEEILTSPDLLANIAGVNYNESTGEVEIKTKDTDTQPKVGKTMVIKGVTDGKFQDTTKKQLRTKGRRG